MADYRFVADRDAVVLVRLGPDGAALAAPIRIEASRSREVDDEDLETWGTVATLDGEDLAQVAARCLNAALGIDREDIATASQALEILVAQQLAKIDADDPVALVEEAMRYVLRQERWRFDIARERREDGVRLALQNPNGAAVPLAVHVSNRGKTPSFWVMQDNRLVQGGHAYKIPIQAATALKTAVEDYIHTHDTGEIRPHG